MRTLKPDSPGTHKHKDNFYHYYGVILHFMGRDEIPLLAVCAALVGSASGTKDLDAALG
jgi:hypothetical protein